MSGPVTDEMVEAVARAICVADGYDPNGECSTTQGYVSRWRIYKAQARAAIAAMPPPVDLGPGLREAIRIVEESKAHCLKRQSLFLYGSPSASAWLSRENEAVEISVILHARLSTFAAERKGDAK